MVPNSPIVLLVLRSVHTGTPANTCILAEAAHSRDGKVHWALHFLHRQPAPRAHLHIRPRHTRHSAHTCTTPIYLSVSFPYDTLFSFSTPVCRSFTLLVAHTHTHSLSLSFFFPHHTIVSFSHTFPFPCSLLLALLSLFHTAGRAQPVYMPLTVGQVSSTSFLYFSFFLAHCSLRPPTLPNKFTSLIHKYIPKKVSKFQSFHSHRSRPVVRVDP